MSADGVACIYSVTRVVSERLRSTKMFPIPPVLIYHVHGIIFNIRGTETRVSEKEEAVIVSVLGMNMIRDEYRGRSAKLSLLRAEERLH